MRISDWSSDVCSSDLAAQRYGMKDGEWIGLPLGAAGACMVYRQAWVQEAGFETFPTDYQQVLDCAKKLKANGHPMGMARSEEHTSELQSLMRISYAVFCLKKKKNTKSTTTKTTPTS